MTYPHPFNPKYRCSLLSQIGQAEVEGLILLCTLAITFAAAGWLGQLVDSTMQTSLATGYAAFQTARGNTQLESTSISSKSKAFFRHAGERAKNEAAISVSAQSVSEKTRLGSGSSKAVELASQWRLDDGRMRIIHTRLTDPGAAPNNRPRAAASTHQNLVPDMSWFNHHQPVIQRQLAILSGAGHSTDDRSAHQHAAESDTAWRSAASKSQRIGRDLEHAVGALDSAWNRAKPEYDWLSKFYELMPSHKLSSPRTAP